MAKEKQVWLSSGLPVWSYRVTTVEDGWLLEIINKSIFPVAFFPQSLHANVRKDTPGEELNPLLILLSENTANPKESILFKLSVTPKEFELLKGNRFRINYGTGLGETKQLTVLLPSS